MDSGDTHTRRRFLKTSAGAVVAGATLAASTGSVRAQEYGGYLDEVDNYDGVTADATEMDEVTITVGAGEDGLLIDPAAVLIEPGTTVEWEWTGEGGAHNVVHDVDEDEQVFDSGDAVDTEGVEYEFTFEEEHEGAHDYVCVPHEAVEMKGVMVVGEENAEGDLVDFDEIDRAAVADDEEGEEEDVPDESAPYDEYLADVENFEGSTVDARGEETVRVEVGAGPQGLLFEPAAVLIEPGTTVEWEWSGEGGAHNAVHDVDSADRVFDSGSAVQDTGVLYDFTFEDEHDGAHNYVCTPHRGQEMKGAIVVGEDNVIGDLGGGGVGRNMTAIFGGSAVFGTVALLGVAAYREMFGEESEY